jgi:hypothetical protein
MFGVICFIVCKICVEAKVKLLVDQNVIKGTKLTPLQIYFRNVCST